MSLSAVKLALSVKRARAQSGAPDVLNSDPIAIIGMGCRFPGNVDSPAAFWSRLRDGVDAIIDLPRGRWPYSVHIPACQGGFLKEVDAFDAGFFGIPPREAERLDPQHRLLMEVIWESLWDARLKPEDLAGARNGVFVAVYNNDYFRMQFSRPGDINAYTSTGTSHSTAVGRISFLLDWKGPSVAIDTACSSSLVSVHLACQSLRSGECRMAVAGGVSLILAPEELISLTRLGMLAPDWRCKTFDARADGFVPGEGCGIVVLKRLSDALMDGDSIHAIIRGTAVNQDGRSTVLTAPNGLSQQSVIRDALANAQVAPSEIGYVEAHGTGTSLGDPIEVEALAEVLGQGPMPCVLGSVKSNFGHLEAAAGVSGLIKTALALKHEEIPRSLHFHRLNPHIRLEGTRLAIADRAVAWSRGDAPRFAGVSSFGFGGTNAHAVLEEPPVFTAAPRPPVTPHIWNRQRYWYAAAALREEQPGEHPLLCRLSSPVLRETVFEANLGAAAPGFLADHRVGGAVLMPMAACIEMFLAASGAAALEELTVKEALELPVEGLRNVQVVGDAATLRLFSQQEGGWKLHASAQIAAATAPPLAIDVNDLRGADARRCEIEEFYAGLEARDLQFGPEFRLIEELWTGPDGALARVRLRDAANDYRLHPALLDGCIQALGALLPDDGGYLPLGLRRFEVYSPRKCTELWSHATLRPGSGNTITGDVRIFDLDGQPVAAAEGVWLRKAAAEAQECMSEIVWQPRPLDTQRTEGVSGDWLVLSDAGGTGAQVAAGLESGGARCITLRRGERFEDLLTELPLCGVVFLWGLDAVPSTQLDAGGLRGGERETCGPLLGLVQRLTERIGQRAALWIATRGAQMADPQQRELSVAQAPLWGLARTIRSEYPDLRCITIDLDPQAHSAERLLDEIRHPDGEDQMAWRGDIRVVPRLFTRGDEPECARLATAAPGRLEELRWEASTRRKPGSGEVEIQVAASGLNFRDVLNALGEYPGDAGPLGSECAGWVKEVGGGVAGLSAGDEVVAVARGSFARFVTTAADLVARKPALLGMEESAASPIAWVTARYALGTVGRMQAGDRVLIHAAAGGVGLAAVAEAQRVGAEIFATAGSPEKRAWLRSLGVRHISNSRTLDYGLQVLEETGGRGVDLVLNSLSGDHIFESLRVLAPGGRFLELGKKGIWDAQRVTALRPDVHYSVIEWGDEYDRNPALISGIFRDVIQDLARGTLRALPCRTFEGRDVVNAFRWMAQAHHIGKIVVRQPSRRNLRSDAAYLITGGLGALGLWVAEWMAKQGAGELILVGRSGAGNHARAAIRAMEEAGARVVVRCADVSRREDIEPVIRDVASRGRRLRGIVHAAGVLEDGVLARQTWDSFAKVMAPKMEGVFHLHELTAGLDLDFFVMFSSLASVLGAPGQGNYAAANAFLDGMAHYRRICGLPAVAINWGPWRGAGMAARKEAAGWQRSFPGMAAMKREQALRLLEKILQEETTAQVAAFALQPSSAARDLQGGTLRCRAGVSQGEALDEGSRQRTRATGLNGRELSVFLREEAAKIIGIPDSNQLDANQPLFDAGLDSLMAVEFRNVLVAAFERPFSSTLLFDHPTLQKLAAFLEAGTADGNGSESDRLAHEIRSLDESEAEALLSAELERMS